MSINVTVTGNPVSIKRGKMVTATDSTHARNEFKKRRKIRLEQVRQQSKEIAETVRNKVRKGINDQASIAEKNAEAKLRDWQNKKLLNLQNQYQECLTEIGLGHMQAAIVEKEELEEQLNTEKNINMKAKERGLLAEEKLQIEQNEKKIKSAIPIQKKRMSREVENTRAAMISNAHKKKTNKKAVANLNICKQKLQDSDFESDDQPVLVNITADDSDNSSPSYSDSSLSKEDTVINKQSPHRQFAGKKIKTSSRERPSSLQQQRSRSKKKKSPPGNETDLSSDFEGKGKRYSNREKSPTIPRLEKERFHERNRSPSPKGANLDVYTTDYLQVNDTLSKVPYDTRISDRIKNRNMNRHQSNANDTEHPYYHRNRNQGVNDEQNTNKNFERTQYTRPKQTCSCGHPLNENCDCDLRASYFERPKKSNYIPMEEIDEDVNMQNDIHNADRGRLTSKHQNEDRVLDRQGTLPNSNERESAEKCIADNRHKEAQKSGALSKKDLTERHAKSGSMSTRQGKSQAQSKRKSSVLSSKPASSKELPTLPTKSLKTPSVKPPSTSDFSKVQCYDHRYRFNKDYIIDNSNVHKISDSSVEVLGSRDSEEDLVEMQNRIFRREHEAEARGLRAMEKERIHRDNIEMLGKLKRLQPKERIAYINPSNDEVHLSQQRLKERGNKRQNALENAFESLFPNTITIPPKNHQQHDNVPFKALTITGSAQPLNQSKWDSNVINEEMKTEDLSALLKKLKGHKDNLLKEVDVAQHSSLSRLINELEKTVKIGNKQTQSDPILSSTSLETPSDMKKTQKTSRSKSKKYKHHQRDVLVLQNMSTQTSPNVIKKPEGEMSEKIPSVDKHSKDKEQGAVTLNGDDQTVKGDEITAIEYEDSIKHKKSNKNKAVHPQNISADVVDQSTADQVTIKSHARIQQPLAGSGENICEILIKLDRNDKPAVVVKSLNKQEIVLGLPNNINQESVVDNQHRAEHQGINIIKRGETVIKSKPIKTKHKSKTKKHIRDPVVSSSTSYYSPPDNSKNVTHPNKEIQNNTMQGHLTNLLQKQKQQSNIEPKYIAPKLLTYIKKLLTMTKGSVENLAISTVSDVSTPSSSVINIETNSHSDLSNVLRYFDLNLADVQANINAENLRAESPTLNYATFPHLDTSKTNQFELTRDYTRASNTLNKSNDVDTTGSSGGYNASQSQNANNTERLNESQQPHGHGVSLSKTDEVTQSHDVRDITLEDYSMQRYPNIVTKYSEIADNCMKRISDLELMIEKVRSEKQQMLSPNHSSDREISTTQYLNLPSTFVVEPQLSDGSTSPEQRKLTVQLLQLNQLPNKSNDDTDPLSLATNSFEAELIKRYLALKHNVDSTDGPEKSRKSAKSPDNIKMPSQNISKSPVGSPKRNKETNVVEEHGDVPYTPLLLDIPKLPKLTTIAEVYEQPSGHKRPPPAKGLTTARRYNDKITAVPHELSTIIEADSRNRSKSPDGFLNQKSTPDKEIIKSQTISELLKPIIVLPDQPTETDKKSSEDSLPDIIANFKLPMNPTNKVSNKSKHREDLINAIKKIQEISTDESSEKSELDVEAMLKSMGMGWAVATLRKTQEALAKSSSTSSFENSTPKVSKSSSEVSLKDFLRNINLTNSDDVSTFSKELQDISAIQGSATSVDKQQRTSTPVQTTKSTDKSKNSKNDSEISKINSDSRSSNKADLRSSDASSSPQEENKSVKFTSMPGYSLDESTI